jgi:hypothetical protein
MKSNTISIDVLNPTSAAACDQVAVVFELWGKAISQYLASNIRIIKWKLA